MKLRSPFSAMLGLGRQFHLLFIAGILSAIGCFTTQTALLLHVYKISSHNAAYMGLIALGELVPFVIASPLSGIVAERCNRKLILIGNEVFRIPIVLLLMMTSNVWLLFVLQCLLSASATLSLPSRQSIIPETVKTEQLQLANSLNGGVSSIMHVLGPVLGAMLYARSGTLHTVAMIEAAACLGAALLLCTLQAPARLLRESDDGEDLPFWQELWEGVRYVRGASDLRQILVILISAGIANGLFTPLLRPYIEEALHGGDALYARMLSAFGIGGLLGPPVGYLLGRWLGVGRTLILTFMIEAVLLTLLSQAHSELLSLAIMVLWGINEFAMVPCYMSYLHLFAKKEMMGRTFALFDQAEFVPQILAAAIIGALGSRLPTQRILTVASVVYLAMMCLTLMSKGGRLLRSPQRQRAT